MIIGIDAGSKFIKTAVNDNGDSTETGHYIEHFGNPEEQVRELLKSELYSNFDRIIFSGLHGEYLATKFKNSVYEDKISALIEAVKYYKLTYRYIVNVGAGSIKLIELDENGDFVTYRENSLCAAGTGSFLDEQMHRMNLDYESIANLPFIQDCPEIATRCAVFAKSDLIHRQQEGYTKDEMWSGLCRGVVITMLQTAFKGDVDNGGILFTGGLFLNPIVRMWLKRIVDKSNFFESGHYLSAVGSALLNQYENTTYGQGSLLENTFALQNDDAINPLKPISSICPDSGIENEYYLNGNEVRIHCSLDSKLTVSVGIDIGSTSTKLVVVDAATKDVLVDIYRKTGGNPIEATKKIFSELRTIFNNRSVEIISIGTTGSGRKLIGKILGAELIVNEITAHFKGATYFDSSIETIFEIGGQDSKYIRGYNGTVVDCNMNYVCAAGTGSFIEEQANRLGFNVKDIGDLVIGLNPPHTSDRCTVFMEQDINKLLRDGYSREEVLSGVIRSIGKNYLNRVVGSRPVTGNKIFYQGATARNRGLVAAFESILNKEVVVSKHCHVMGAFGAAILSIDSQNRISPVSDRLEIFNQDIKLSYKQCSKCTNACKITIATLENGRRESWGYMCGKEDLEEKRKKRPQDSFNDVIKLLNIEYEEKMPKTQTNLKRIGIPQVLTMFNYLPLWKRFFNELGISVVTSGKSTNTMKDNAISISRSDFCFPLKMGLAHIRDLDEREDIDAIFYPSSISEKNQRNEMPRMFCPYVITFPSVSRESLDLNKEIISPVIDFRYREDIIINDLHKCLSKYGFTLINIKRAYKRAFHEFETFKKNRFNAGEKLLSELSNTNKTGIVIMGRPYNLYDKMVNLGLSERFNEYGHKIFPYEYLLDPEGNEPNVSHMYWNYGEKILAAAKKIREMDGVYPVYFTNFSCGPDSFILTRFEEIMQGKPYLIIELDEHGSETGYLTRIEAFLDVVCENEKSQNRIRQKTRLFKSKWKKKEMKLWFPPMFEYMPDLFAAALRGWDFDSEPLPLEDNSAFEYGKQNIRGSECLPASTTIGAFIKKMKEIDADPSKHALFMPTAEGPCRFGQYSVLHRKILNENGYGEAEIFSPTSTNSYLGMTDGLRKYLFDVMMCGDSLAKYIYHKRPYEKNSGEFDLAAQGVLKDLVKAIENRENLIEATGKALEVLSVIPVDSYEKPLIGIVGEIYVRSNPFCNNFVIRYIEKSGGESWLSPLSEWVLYTAWMERYITKKHRKNLIQRILVNAKTGYMFNRIYSFEHAMGEFLHDRVEPDIERVLRKGSEYVPMEFEGEVILTIGRAIVFLEDGADMVINCAPFGCMPGNITTSIFQKISKEHNKPIINLFYDGECDVNRIIGVYLNNIKKEKPDFVIEAAN